MGRRATGVFGTLLSQVWRNRERMVNVETLLRGALGITDESGRPVANELELANPVPFLLLNQIARPGLEATLPSEIIDLLETLSGGKAVEGPPLDEQVDQLKALVTQLQTTVQEQGVEIQTLRRRNR